MRQVLTSRVYDVARETSLDEAPRLSDRCGNTVLLKREDLQPIFSFKLRGAYNRMAHLTAEERSRGVICASAPVVAALEIAHAQPIELYTFVGFKAIWAGLFAAVLTPLIAWWALSSASMSLAPAEVEAATGAGAEAAG